MRALGIAFALALALSSSVLAQADSTTVNLAEQNDSGISGSATLTQVGSDLRVVVTVTGSPAGGSHPAHIHSGRCPSPGGVVHGLNNIVDGTSTTLLAGISLSSVTDGGHSINLHVSDDNLGPSGYIACGDIATVAAADPTATTEAVAEATATAAMPGLPATGAGGAAGTGSLLWLLAGLAVVAAVTLAGVRRRLTTTAG